jgi:tRNA (guanosine-2'-O-)-methyltransferase
MKIDFDSRYEALLPFLSEERVQRFDAVLQERTRHIHVVLENVYQSRNASAVMRSCDGMGIQDVHLIEDINPWVYNRTVSKGTPSWLTLHRYRQQVDPTGACIQHLRQNGFRIAVTSPHVDGFNVDDVPVDQPLALVMGTEWKGVSDRMLAEADYHVAIPMHGFAESLNISVAAAIALYELSKRCRELPQATWALSGSEKEVLRGEWAMRTVRKSDLILKRLGISPETGRPFSGKK